MAFPTDTFTPTDLATLIPEVWGSKINDFFKKKLVAANFFIDRSEELVGGGDTLHTPNLTEMSANAKVNATAVTLNSPTETEVQLVVNQWFEVSFMIEDKEAEQVKRTYSIQERYAQNAAYTAAKSLDTALVTLFTGFTATQGAAVTDITDDVIRASLAVLDGNDIDMDEVAFIMHPTTLWNQVQKLDRFALVQNTTGADPITKGPAGMLYGHPIFSSTNVITTGTGPTLARINALVHPDALHWASAPLPGGNSNGPVRLQAQYQQDFLGTLTTADILYGVVENRDNAGVQILTTA